jgi:hypothetical protein
VNAIARHAAHFPPQSRGVLIVANHSQDARVTARLVAAMHARESVRIHVAAVQRRPNGYAGRFLKRVDVRAALEQAGRESMAALCAELDALGVPYRPHVEIAPWLAGIGRLARELGCARVVVGANPRHGLRDAALKMDRWRIRAALRAQGLACAVVRGDESAAPASPNVAAGSAAQS